MIESGHDHQEQMFPMKFIYYSTESMLQKHPWTGYLAAAVPTSAGFWSILERVKSVGAVLSIIVGLSVGAMTFYVQYLQAKELRRAANEK